VDLEDGIWVKPASRKRVPGKRLVVGRTEHMRRWPFEAKARHGHTFGFRRHHRYIASIPSGVWFGDEISKDEKVFVAKEDREWRADVRLRSIVQLNDGI
jgi:hypothetical protein